MTQTIKLKRQLQTGASAVGKKPPLTGTGALQAGELAVNTYDGKLFLRKLHATNPTLDTVVEVGANPFPTQTNNSGKFLTTNGTSVLWSLPNTISAAAHEATQTSHGFTVGTIVYHDGTNYVRAIAQDPDPAVAATLTGQALIAYLARADVIGIITNVTDANHFTVTTNGMVNFTGTSISWVAGQTYFLSATNAGVLTPTEPVAAGQISKPLIIATDSKKGMFYNWRGISNEIPLTDIDTLLPPQDASTVDKVLTSGSDGNSYWSDGGSGGGAASIILVTQTSHGFAVGTILRYDGTLSKYVKSLADNATNADVIGIVSAVTGVDDFKITTQGVVQGLSGLTPGTSYFLSATTAGGRTATEPSAFNSISKPVLLAISATSALFTNWRGIGVSVLSQIQEVAPQTGNSGKYLSTNGVSTIWSTPVTSFNTRTGPVTMTSSDVTLALGYTPYNGTTNPNDFVTETWANTQFTTTTILPAQATHGGEFLTTNGTTASWAHTKSLNNTTYGTELYSQSAGYWSFVGNGGSTNIQLRDTNAGTIRGWISADASGQGFKTPAGVWAFKTATSTTRGSTSISGSTGGYTGINYVFAAGDTVGGMFDASGNGGDFDVSTGWHYFWDRTNACLGIGGNATTAGYKAHTNGNHYIAGYLYATGEVYAYSDARLKENITTVENALDLTKRLRGVFYNKVDDANKTRKVGVIAQEIQQVLPEVVMVDKDEFAVSYGNITAVLIEAVKELSKKVEDLTAEVNTLKS